MYGYNDLPVLPQDLQDFAWLAPMRDLAPKVGLSDVGLKKDPPLMRHHHGAAGTFSTSILTVRHQAPDVC